MAADHRDIVIVRASDLTSDIDLAKKPDGDENTIRALCIFKKIPREKGAPPHTVLIIEGLNEEREHYFYEIDFVPSYNENFLLKSFLPCSTLANFHRPGIIIPWYYARGKVRVRGHNVDFGYFNIENPQSDGPYGYLPEREPDTLKELLRTKIVASAAMCIGVITKETEDALLEDIRNDFFRNNTDDPLIYNFRGLSVSCSKEHEISSKKTEETIREFEIENPGSIEDAIRLLSGQLQEIGDHYELRERGNHVVRFSKEDIRDKTAFFQLAALLHHLPEEEKERLKESLRQSELAPPELKFSGSAHNCMTWPEEKVKTRGITIDFNHRNLSQGMRIIGKAIDLHHPDEISKPADISRERARFFAHEEAEDSRAQRRINAAIAANGGTLTIAQSNQIFYEERAARIRALRQEEREPAPRTGFGCNIS